MVRVVRITVCMLVLVLLSVGLFAQETTTVVTTKKSEGLWNFGGSMSVALGLNPWMLTDSGMYRMGFDVGLETVLSYGLIGVSMGYYYLGTTDSLPSNQNRYYVDFYDVGLFAKFEKEVHAVTFVPMFVWPKGVIRPYVGIGPALIIDVHSYKIGASVAGIGAGSSVLYEEIEITAGLSTQAGINFVLGKHILVGAGLHMLVKDFDMIYDVNMTTAEVFKDSTSFMMRVGYAF